MHATKRLTVPGDRYVLDAGRKLIHVTYCGGTGPMAVYSVEITTNSVVARPVGNDDRSFNSQDVADHYARMALDTLLAEQNGVDTDALAAQLLTDEAERTIARDEVNRAAQTDVDTVMATPRGLPGAQQPRATMAGAHLADVTDPQRRALNAHTDGTVFVGPGVGAATLKSLARKGYGRLRYEGRRYTIVALVLNARGLAEAGVSA